MQGLKCAIVRHGDLHMLMQAMIFAPTNAAIADSLLESQNIDLDNLSPEQINELVRPIAQYHSELCWCAFALLAGCGSFLPKNGCVSLSKAQVPVS